MTAMPPEPFVRGFDLNPNLDPQQRIQHRLRSEDPIHKLVNPRLQSIRQGANLVETENSFRVSMPGPQPAPGLIRAPVDPALQPPEPQLHEQWKSVEIDSASVIRRVQAADPARILRIISAGIPSIFPSSRWHPQLLDYCTRALGKLFQDISWLETNLGVLSLVNPHWDSNRAARALSFVAVFQILLNFGHSIRITDPEPVSEQKESVEEDFPDPAEDEVARRNQDQAMMEPVFPGSGTKVNQTPVSRRGKSHHKKKDNLWPKQ
jgi:hypothetical protein